MKEWNNLKPYQKGLRMLLALVMLAGLLFAAIFLIALFFAAAESELGYNGDTHIEEKKAWWE